MNVRITKADESRLSACHEVFLDSALYDHYFSQEGRLDKQLSTAINGVSSGLPSPPRTRWQGACGWSPTASSAPFPIWPCWA